MPSNVTDLAVRNAKPRDARYKMSDAHGLYLLVMPTGAKHWRFDYRFGSRRRTLSIGPYPLIALSEARDARDKARRLLRDGLDPIEQQRLERIEADLKRGVTFAIIADELIAKMEREGRADATMTKTRWLIDYARPQLGARPISEVSAPEVLAVLRKIEDRVDHRLERAAKQERLTELDRILRQLAREGELAIRDLPEQGHNGLLLQLNRLEDWGLAQRVEPGLWPLDPELEDKLTRLADAREREAATERILAREGRELTSTRCTKLEDAHSRQRVTCRLLGFEPLSDNARGPCLIAVDGIDVQLQTARAACADDLRDLNGVERDAIVEVGRDDVDIKPSDRTIGEIAQEHELVYSGELHRESRSGDREKYIQMHERRLDALARDGIVERDRDGSFVLPPDYLEQVLGASDRLRGSDLARPDRIGTGGQEPTQPRALLWPGLGRGLETTSRELGLGQNIEMETDANTRKARS